MTALFHAQSMEHFERPAATLSGSEPLAMERVLNTSIVPVDDIIDGFRPSTTTLLDSDARYASELLHVLCVQALEEFDEEVLWIDGGNVVDPYVISALCKRRGLDSRELLSMVNVARAFTAYQLASLVDGFLDREARESTPSTVIISSISDMFMDNDVRRSEAYQLLRGCAKEIVRVTRDSQTITVVTSHTPGRVKPDPRIMSVLSDAFDVYVQMRCVRDGIAVRVPREARSTSFTPVPWNQTVLNDFMGGIYGEDCAHIPPRA